MTFINDRRKNNSNTNLMKYGFFIWCLLWIGILAAQTDYFRALHDAHASYRDDRLTDRRFKHRDIVPIVQGLGSDFRVVQAGESVEGRAIYRVSIGTGPTQVLLWSQMHGDEPTATAAVCDIFRFLQARNDGFDALREQLLSKLTLTFIPMLNPDGAERFMRRNSLGIDLNRDALRLTTPEARLLKAIRDELEADWGFNLHDQSVYYGAGYPTDNMATLAFLAPAYNFAKSVNSKRERAMLLIGQLNQQLQTVIPGKVARYSDAFEPRAFGDNMQLWGTSTILIESGGYPGDREKQYIRQLNFATLLSAFHSIANQHYQRYSRQDYSAIPYNQGGLYHDLLLRNLSYRREGQDYTLDLAFRLSEREVSKPPMLTYRASISDLGDLSYHRGYEELDGTGLRVSVAQVYPHTFPDLEALQAQDPYRLLADGYAVVKVAKLDSRQWVAKAALPLLLISPQERVSHRIMPGNNPALLLRDASNKVHYAITNGRLIPVD
ncbi:MAG: peptidase M14 [Bacteroidetes bacterium]|nr:MAG: peptidase M14 [Bacteroidota bacterium]